MDTAIGLRALIRAFPALDLPLPASAGRAHAMRTGPTLAVVFTFHEDANLPAHSHGAQWGGVLAGQVPPTGDGESGSFAAARAT